MGWEQLVEIRRLDCTERAEAFLQAPSACPNDGEPLQVGPHGELFCVFDGWRYRL